MADFMAGGEERSGLSGAATPGGRCLRSAVPVTGRSRMPGK